MSIAITSLVAAIMFAESGGQPQGINSHGAAGKWQIKAAVVQDVNRHFGQHYRWPESALHDGEARNICTLHLLRLSRAWCVSEAEARRLALAWRWGVAGSKKHMRGKSLYWERVKG